MTVTERRTAGVLLPLFSVRSRADWGVGELPSFGRLVPALRRARVNVLMTLPLLEPSPGQESPYSPVSAFALDPLYVALDAVPEMRALGGREALSGDDRAALVEARGARAVRHDRVRPLKMKWLRRCHAQFRAHGEPARRAAFEQFREAHRGWLDDYALFRTLKAHHPQSWRAWPEPLRERHPSALEQARAEHAEEIEWRAYIQWLAFDQLRDARSKLAAAGIALGGDEPFLVAEDSADVWSQQTLYRFDATVGAPPDAFSATGQDWGLPPYRWDRIAEQDYGLFRERGRHAARLFDLVRIDHVVGLYRTYHRPVDGTECYFVPGDEAAQRHQGESVLRAWGEAGTALIAEDLGVIPDFVRASLDAMRIPGFRVLRWEERDGRWRCPRDWPEVSVATNGTHDTETSAVWWESLADHTFHAIREIPQLGALPEHAARAYHRDVEAALLEALYESPSRLLVLPAQDVFGLRERINVPNTVGPQNWSWRLPWSLEGWLDEDHVAARLDALGELAVRFGRG